MKKYLKKYRAKLIMLTILGIIRQALLVIAQQLNGRVIDVLLSKNLESFIWVIVQIIIVWAAVIGLDIISNINEEAVSLDIQESIREDVSNKMINTDYKTFNQVTHANYVSWLNNDINTISEKGLRQYFNLVKGLSGVIFAAYAMIGYHWSLLLATAIGFICMFYIPRLFDKSVTEVSKEVSYANEEFVSGVEDELKGYSVYFANSSLFRFVSKIKYLSKALKQVIMKQVKLDAGIIAVNFSVNVFFQILLTFMAGICYFKGSVEIGALSIVGSLANIIFSGLGEISYQISSIKSVEPIFEKFDKLTPEDIKELPLEKETSLYDAGNLSLKYGDDLIFQNLSFDISKGDKCLLTGLSGSGKSSLLKMLLGYDHDFSGVLKYQGTNIKDVSSKTIAEEVYYLPQETHVFKASVRENIELGDKFTEEEILDVLSTVGFEEPKELISVNASQLSGGQKQRLSLARALIRKPKVLICDEITSALDKESGEMIENLLLSKEGLTVIMITHNLHSNRNMFNNFIEL